VLGSDCDLKQSDSIQHTLTFRKCKCEIKAPTAVIILNIKALIETASIQDFRKIPCAKELYYILHIFLLFNVRPYRRYKH